MTAPAAAWSWTKGVFVLVVFALGAISLAAGGLGLAPVAAVGGLGALVLAAVERRLARPGPAVLAAAALLGWATLSMTWSAFDRPDQLLRTLIGAPLYLGFALLCASLEGPGRRLARAGLVLCVAAAGAVFAFELATRGAITGAYRAEVGDMNQVWRNLGHGLSAWVLLLPAALLVLPRRDAAATALGAALLAVAVGCALGFGITSNLAGLVGALLGGAAARRWPRASAWGVGALAAFAILAAPALGLLAQAVPDAWRDAIPDSWELRLEAWGWTVERIGLRPLSGWGFDASRAISETIEFKGYEVKVLPLHPHNAGLHLWLETGLVGVGLAAAVVLLAGRAVARAPGLTRSQAVAGVAAASAYVVMAQVSYGVWQEWWLAAIAWAAGAAALVGPAAADPEADR
jgi:O-antigen ligase